MARFFWRLFISFAGLLLAGCTGPAPKEVPIWQQVKISDLAGRGAAEPNQRLSDEINIDIYIFDIPAEDANVLEDVWTLLYTQPLRFNNYDAFAANLFAAGFGEAASWNDVANILRATGARMAERDSLVLLDGRARNIIVTAMDSEQTVFYTSGGTSPEGITIGPGSLALRIMAEKIPGQRGVCQMNVQPVFSSVSTSRGQAKQKSSETVPFAFDALGIRLKISPGSYLLLGPKRYTAGASGLAAMFFGRTAPRPAARIFMFVCRAIAD